MTEPLRVLVAGDRFVRPQHVAAALRKTVERPVDVRELTLEWPYEPFGPVGDVQEACGDEDELIAALAGREVAVTQMGAFTRRVIEAADALRLIAVCRGGPVNVSLAAAAERGIRVAYAPGRNAVAAAEYAVGLLLAALRRIPETHATMAAGEWRGDYYAFDRCGGELEGAPVGLVGFGAIGSRVARVLAAFGAEVLVHDPYADPDAVVASGARGVELDELLERSMAISLHARLTEETRGMIGPAELARLPAGAVVVNTARGGLLDEDALCDALDAGHLAGAALDVYADEPPPPDARLRRTPGLVLSPHLAGASRGTAERAAAIVAAEVARYARGEPLAHPATSA